MSSRKFKPPKQKKRPPPWRKPEHVELSEEIRGLERDIAIHSEPPFGATHGQTQAHDVQPGTQECDKAEPEKPTMSWTRKRRRAASMKNPVPWRKKHLVDLGYEICDLERDIALHPDSPATGAAYTSTRDARALSRAARRMALVGASEVREARKPKSAAQKQQQPAVTCYREDPRRASEMATPQSPEVTEAPIMPEVAAGRRAEPLQRQPEVIDLTGED